MNFLKEYSFSFLWAYGIFIAGKDIFHAVDALERLDWQAWCLLAQGMLPSAPVGYQSLETR